MQTVPAIKHKLAVVFQWDHIQNRWEFYESEETCSANDFRFNREYIHWLGPYNTRSYFSGIQEGFHWIDKRSLMEVDGWRDVNKPPRGVLEDEEIDAIFDEIRVRR